jgi:methyl-accepting chemotaxis protein
MAKYRRSKFLVKKGLQFRYMWVIVITMLFMTMISSWIIYFTIWSGISSGDLKTAADLANIFDKVNHDLMVWIPIFIALIAFASIFVSHRIAGPIYRFEESAKMIAEGDLSLKIHLRKGDELKDLANTFNTMTEKLEKIVKNDRKVISKIIHIIKELPMDLKSDDLSSKRKDEIIQELVTIVDDLKLVTSSYQLSKDEKDSESHNI